MVNPSIKFPRTKISPRSFAQTKVGEKERYPLLFFSLPREKSDTFLLLALFVASHLLTKRRKTTRDSQFSLLDSHNKDPGISASLMGSPALTAPLPLPPPPLSSSFALLYATLCSVITENCIGVELYRKRENSGLIELYTMKTTGGQLAYHRQGFRIPPLHAWARKGLK